MKKIFLLATFMLSFLQLRADEGMWLLMLVKRLNSVDMQKEGLHLTPEEIYSVNHSSVKDAIVQFGGGCTAEMVSSNGLLFTNHHCGYSSIAALSTPEKDYLTNGYWAKTHQDEIPAPGLSVRFLVRMGDATERINQKLNANMTAEQRKKVIEAEYNAIKSENSENGKYTVVVKDFFKGNEFYYFVYQDYKDVRLVGTPPKSLGKFGGDTDNWEWPRHTADFSVFRVYADANNNPSNYAPTNVPFKPEHSLPISLNGYQKNSFAMILGFPGTTHRYLTSYGINQMIKGDYPAWVEASKQAMDVMKKYMDKDHATKLKYASQYASVANYWKNRQGTIDAVLKNNTIGDKQKVEKDFLDWVKKNNKEAEYGNAITEIENYYQTIYNRNVEKNYGAQLQRNSKYILAGYYFGDFLRTYTNQNPEQREQMKEKALKAVDNFYKNFNTSLEAEMLSQMVYLYQQRVANDVASPTLKAVNANGLSLLAQSSIFANKESMVNFINQPDQAKLEADPLMKLANAYIKDNDVLQERFKSIDESLAKNSRLFLKGLMESQPKKSFYPDANSTMRLTYGKVTTLPERADRNYYGIGEKENYYTDVRGMVQKYKKGDEDFDLPQDFLDLVAKKDFGRYADKRTGLLQVNFLSDNDITGGNSGSPVLDADGNLIGLAFDGNSEALSGDIVFEPKWQKTISVDVRFVLWVMEKYGKANRLIRELKLVQ